MPLLPNNPIRKENRNDGRESWNGYHQARFDFSIERVFDAWLDPAKASKFLFTTPTGKMVRVEIDARVGGSFNITRRDGEDVEHVGTYVEIDRARRLASPSECRSSRPK